MRDDGITVSTNSLHISKTPTVKCGLYVPHLPPLTYHQSGDFIIGVIASHSFIVSNTLIFKEEPLPTVFDEIK